MLSRARVRKKKKKTIVSFAFPAILNPGVFFCLLWNCAAVRASGSREGTAEQANSPTGKIFCFFGQVLHTKVLPLPFVAGKIFEKKKASTVMMLRDATNTRQTTDDASTSASRSSLKVSSAEGARRGGKIFEDIHGGNNGRKVYDDDVERTRRSSSQRVAEEEEEEEEEEEDDLARDYTIELLSDEFVSEFLFDPTAFDSMRAESERCCGSALEALYPTSVRQMNREELLKEKSNLKRRLRAYDARLMKVNNIVASKADKKHARPLYARLARVKQQIELLEIRDGLEVLPNLKVAAIGTAN